MNKRYKNMFGIGIVAILILYLSAQSFSNALSFYYEVGEFVQKATPGVAILRTVGTLSCSPIPACKPAATNVVRSASQRNWNP